MSGGPRCAAVPLQQGVLELGRGQLGSDLPPDSRMSRRHARVHYDGQRFFVADLGSQNGTYLDGAAVASESRMAQEQVLRTGDSLFLLSADLRPYQLAGVALDDTMVKGHALQAAHEQAARAARFGDILHITGESGAGKEGLARAFHAAAPRRSGAFVAVNCATIAEGLAERLLFGAKRGAYSGSVADADGFVQAAHGGTLFLDEVAELPLPVQAKLLRVLENREVLPLGANKPVPVQLHLVSATHKDLRVEVGAGRFREDLYFRLSRPKISLPPLRERREEIPWLIDRALKQLAPQLEARPSLVELCLLRHWPGNVRELLAEVRTAGLAALAVGQNSVEVRHLCEEAGRNFPSQSRPQEGSLPGAPKDGAAAAADAAVPPPPSPRPTPAGGSSLPEGLRGDTPLPRLPHPPREAIEDALRAQRGNISGTARALGLHRTQLKRLMLRYHLTAAQFGATGEDDAAP